MNNNQDNCINKVFRAFLGLPPLQQSLNLGEMVDWFIANKPEAANARAFVHRKPRYPNGYVITMGYLNSNNDLLAPYRELAVRNISEEIDEMFASNDCIVLT